MRRFLAKALVLVAGVGLIVSCTSGSSNNTSSSTNFSGTTIRVVTFTGPQIAEPLQRRAPDFQMVYYRKDLLQKDGLQPPATWDDYISIAKHFQGKDLNGDGKNDYGSCLAMKRSAQSYWAWISIAAAYLQSKGTKQGAFFNTDNMQPLTNNPGAAAALDVYKQLSKIGPPDQLNNDVGDSRGLFVTGRCALSLDWGDIGTLAIDPTQSKV